MLNHRWAALPAQKPAAADRIRPNPTLAQQSQRMQEKLPSRATAAPEIPATRAWLSLVGMPKHQASPAHRTIAVIAAHRAVRAARVPPPNEAME